MSTSDDLFAETAPDKSVFVKKHALDPLASPAEIRGRETYTVINPDALDALFSPRNGVLSWNDASRIEFSFDGYWVTATASGEVSASAIR